MQVRRCNEAESGEFEGFNALSRILTEEFGAVAVDVLRRDLEIKYEIADRCIEAWDREHTKHAAPGMNNGRGVL